MPSAEMNDFEMRKNAFLPRYKALIDEFQVDLHSTPIFVPTEEGMWSLTEFAMRVDIVDTKMVPKASPIQFPNIQF